jgi:hypothetical protein
MDGKKENLLAVTPEPLFINVRKQEKPYVLRLAARRRE